VSLSSHCFNLWKLDLLFIPSRKLMEPGIFFFLDSQLQDTQFFGFGDSQSMHGHDRRALAHVKFYDGIPALSLMGIYSVEATPYEILVRHRVTSPSTADTPLSVKQTLELKQRRKILSRRLRAEIKKDRSTIIIHYEIEGLALKWHAWTQLDAFINGLTGSYCRVWIQPPNCKVPNILAYSARLLDLISKRRCEAESDLMHQLRWDIHQLYRHGWTCAANIVQGSSCGRQITVQVLSWNDCTAHSSNLPRMQELINVATTFLAHCRFWWM